MALMSISSSTFLSYFQKPVPQQVQEQEQELIRISTTTSTSGSSSRNSSCSCSSTGSGSGRSCSVSGSSRRNSTNGTTVIQEAPQVLEHSYLHISSQSDTCTSITITTPPTTSRSCPHEDRIKPIRDTITVAEGITTSGNTTSSNGDSPIEDKEMLLCKEEKRGGIKREEEDGTIVKEDHSSSKTSSSTTTTTRTTPATSSTSPSTRTWLPLDHSDLLVPSLAQPPSTKKTTQLHPPPPPNQYYSIAPYSPLPLKKRMLLRTSMEERQQHFFNHLHEQRPISNNYDTNQIAQKDDVEAAAISLLGVCSFLKFPHTTISTNTTGKSDIHDSNCNLTAALVIEDEEEGEISNICYNKNHDNKNDATSAPQRTHTTITQIYNGPWKKRKHEQQLSTPYPSVPPSPISSHGNSSIVSSSTATTTTNTTSQSSYYGTALSLPNTTSYCILLNALPVSQWKGQRVEILTGPFQSHTGTVQRWKNGWITVQLQLDRTKGAVATTNASPTISSSTSERRQHDNEEEVTILHHPRRAVDLKVIPHDTLSQKSILNNTSSNNPIHLDGVVRHSPIATVTAPATTTTTTAVSTPNQPNPTNNIVVQQSSKDDTTKAYGATGKNLPLLITSKHSLHSNTEPILTTTARPEKNSNFSTHDDILLHSNVSSASSVTISTCTVTKANQELLTLQKEPTLTQVTTDSKSCMSNNHDSNNSSHYKSWMATAAFDRPRRSIKKPQIYDDKYFEEKKRLLREAAKKGKYITTGTKNSSTISSGGSSEGGSAAHEDDDSSNLPNKTENI